MGWANIRGVYLMCRAILPGMIERGVGDIININVASVRGKRPLPKRTPSNTPSCRLLIATST